MNGIAEDEVILCQILLAEFAVDLFNFPGSRKELTTGLRIHLQFGKSQLLTVIQEHFDFILRPRGDDDRDLAKRKADGVLR